MAGTLVLLCEFIVETIWHIVAFLAYGMFFPGIAFCIAFIFEGWFKYQKGSCVTGKQLLPSLALPRLLFFPLWFLMLEVLAISGWILWYFEGRWCEAFIALGVWAATFIVLAIFPIVMFVTNSFLLSFLVFAFVTLWTIILIGVTAVFSFNVVAVLLQVIFLIWVAYNTLWTLIAWRNKGFRFPNPKEIIQDAYGVLVGDPSAPVPNLFNAQGQPWIPGDAPASGGSGSVSYASPGFAPSPCAGGFGGGPLATQCPQYVGQEAGGVPSYGQQQQPAMPGVTQRFNGAEDDWNL